ncbi:MAG: hypothetical protein AAGJ28_22045 [Pseudomonadota bacterium]
MILLIAMPTQGDIATPTVKSLIGFTQKLREWNIPFAFETYEFSDIVFSRNQLMSIFLTRERFTHCLFLDSDMGFTPDAIRRLIEIDVDFAATAYPQKHPRWTRLRQLIEAEAALPQDQRTPMDRLLARAWLYNHQRAAFGGQPWVPKQKDGFITVPATGTGMMLMTRTVPERMVEQGAAAPKPAMANVPLHKDLRYHDFFSHLTSPDGGLMYGEDQSFCMRWVEHCGGDIWLDTRSPVVHYGVKAFPGRFAEAVTDDFPDLAT